MATTDARRSVTLSRLSAGRFRATNRHGATIEFGTGDGDFSPVDLLLAAIGGCTGIDVDIITTRRSEPDAFDITVSADKVTGASGNRLQNVDVSFALVFPADAAGDAARGVLDSAIAKSRDRLCTVSRTVELPTTVTMHAVGVPG